MSHVSETVCIVIAEENFTGQKKNDLATLALFTPLTAKSFNLNFHPLEVVSR